MSEMRKLKKIKSAGKAIVSAPSNIFDKIYLTLIIIIACSAALAMIPRAYNYVLIKLAIAQFLLIIVFVLWLYQILEKGEISFYKDPSFIALAFLTAWLVINLLTSSFMYASIRELSRLLTCFFLYFVVVNLIKREKDLLSVVVFIIVVFAGLSFHALFNYLHNKNPVIISTFGNPNFFSAYLVTILPVVILLGIYNFIRKNFFVSSLFFILTIITIFLLHLLGSRGAWLALAVSLLFLLILFGKYILKPKWKTSVAIGLVIVLFVGSGFLIQKAPQIKSYLENEMTKGTVGVRLYMWQGTLKMILARPFLGWGMGTFIIVYPRFRVPEYFLNIYSVNATDHAHNEILQTASEIGLIGLGIFLLFLGIVFFRGIRVFNRQSLDLSNIVHAGLLAGVIALFTQNMTCVNLRLEASAIYFYLFLGLICAGCKLRDYPLQIKTTQEEKNYFNKKFPKNKILLWFIVPIAILLGILYTNATVKMITSSVYLKTALVLREQERWKESIQKFQKAIKWNRYNWKAYYRLAFVYARINKTEEALNVYLKLKELAPNYADINYNLGSIYLRIGKWENALTQLQVSLQLNPYEPKTYCNVGAVYMHFGDEDKALASYQTAAEIQELKKKINPNLEDFGGAYAGMGEVYYYKKQWEEAAQNYIKAMQSGKKNVRILLRLGDCYFNMKDFTKARQAYEEALKTDPSLTRVEKFVERLDKIIEFDKNGKQ